MNKKIAFEKEETKKEREKNGDKIRTKEETNPQI